MQLTKAEAAEYRNCATSAVYTIQKYGYLKHIKRGAIRWKPYDWQVELIDTLQRGENVVALKSRQVGASWTAAGYIAWLISFKPDIEILLLSVNQLKAIKLLSKVKFVCSKFPSFIRRDFGTDSKTQLSTVHKRNGSTVISESVVYSLTTTGESGRGDTAYFIFADELAHLPNDEETWTAVLPAISRGGQILCASSPNGPENVFARVWFDADSGESASFTPMRIHYTDCGFGPEWLKKASDGMTDEKIMQEYELAFVGAGSPAFDPIHLKECFIPMDMIMSDPELVDIRQLVISSRKFYTGVDSAEIRVGKGVRRKDYNAITSLNVYGIQMDTETNQEPLHKWAGKTEDIGDQKVEIPGYVSRWHWEHPGLMYIEENSSGLTVGNRHIVPDNPISEMRMKRTTVKSKPRMVNQLKLAFAGKQILITDKKTYYQLLNFQDLGNGKYEAVSGMKDDLVLALMLAWDALIYDGGKDFILPSIEELGYIPLAAEVDLVSVPSFSIPPPGLHDKLIQYESLQNVVRFDQDEWDEFLPTGDKLERLRDVN